MLVSDKVGVTANHCPKVKLHAFKRCSHAPASSVVPRVRFRTSASLAPGGGRIDVVVRVEGQSTVTSIKDTGMGLAANQLAKVLKLFTQIENPTARAKTGLGIGLALARQLVDLHGGEIEARSEGLGQGSEFVVRLPTCVEAN